MPSKHQNGVHPDDRLKRLNAERHRKMAASAHAYVRGSTTRFYEWLEQSNRQAIPEGPPVWICGDCHVGNLGPVAGGGALAIQIRDLDQTVIGNPAHDLIRLSLSLAMAARGSDLPGVTTAHMLEHMIDGYAVGLADSDGETGAEMSKATPKLVRSVMRQAAGRSWKHLADERIEGLAPVIPLGRRFWPLTPEERSEIDTLFGEASARQLANVLRSGEVEADIRVLDAAYWRKGCSSLGRLRYAVLVAVGQGRNQRHCLMDVKEAIAPAAPRSSDAIMPRDNAERVVTGARNLSPLLGERMVTGRLLGKAVFVRELMPQDLKLEIEHLSQEEAMQVAGFLARIVGESHARQMSGQDRKGWSAELQHNRTKMLDAPTWLWNSVVDLVGTHEAAYLNHCRRYAMADAA